MVAAASIRIDRQCVPTLVTERPKPIVLDEGASPAVDDSDIRLVEAVQLALRGTGHPSLRTLDVAASRGVVRLYGQVPTYHQKQLAQVTAQQVNGVRGISNGLVVAGNRRDEPHRKS